MSNNEIKKLRTIKTLIIPKLPSNFHESLFFSEIQYEKNPSKKLKNYLINLYIQGVDYYTTTNQKDLSFYFQTKLLKIMKGTDYFEKISSKKIEENNIDELIESQKEKFLNQEKNIDDNINNFIIKQLKEQQEQFLLNLTTKKKLMKYKRKNTTDIRRKTIQNNNLNDFSKRTSFKKISKKVSVDLTSSLINNKENEKNKNINNIFSKVENALNGLDRINTLLIIQYSKMLKNYMKKEFQSMNERIDKYNEYIKAKNELNLIYEQFEDKDNDEAKSIKEQIDICQKDWEEFNKKNLGQNDKYFDMVQLNEKDLNNFIDNIYKKIEDIKLK